MSVTSFLVWLEKGCGVFTRADAERRGFIRNGSWDDAKNRGLFVMNKDMRLSLTAVGREYLNAARMGA